MSGRPKVATALSTADAIGAFEQKAKDLLAQAVAHRELSSSLAHDDAT